jgi:hypothetical protein
MAAGNTYPVDITNPEGTEVKSSGQVVFTDSTKQPDPQAPPITSGTLPNSGAWVSGTAKQNPVGRKITMVVEVAGDASNNAASVTVAISPDNTTYTTIATPSIAAALNNLGALVLDVPVTLPQGWWIKLTIGAHATVAASIYW